MLLHGILSCLYEPRRSPGRGVMFQAAVTELLSPREAEGPAPSRRLSCSPIAEPSSGNGTGSTDEHSEDR
jgi:hypothetical protein